MQLSRALCALVLAACTASITHAQAAYNKAEAEQYIHDSESAWSESTTTSDTSVVKRILADDLVWVLDGRVLDKAQAVADAANGPGDFLSDHLLYAHIRFFGNTAVVQGSEIWTRKGGKKGHFVWTDTWLFRDGKWQIVAAEDDTVPIKY